MTADPRIATVVERRIKVACINWGHPDAPHATTYVHDPTEGAIIVTYHDTWLEAMEQAEVLVYLLIRAAAR